jgi:hypothetical protein
MNWRRDRPGSRRTGNAGQPKPHPERVEAGFRLESEHGPPQIPSCPPQVKGMSSQINRFARKHDFAFDIFWILFSERPIGLKGL